MSLREQPKAVWAVAFACVIAFMGIGLVDPILPVLAQDLDATPSQVSLLFTSYFAITGVSMLVTGYVSSRIGPRRTLLGGLVLVIVFSALAGASGSHPRDRRLPRRLGPRQRALHRHRAGRDHGLGQRRHRRRDHPLRGRARARHRLRPAARRLPRRDLLARAVLRHRGADGDRLRRDLRAARGAAQARAQGRADRAAARAAPPRAADHGPGRALLQLRLLHAAGLHAVPAEDGRARARARVLRLGPAAGDQLGVRRAAAQAPLRRRAHARRDVRRAGRDPRDHGLRRGRRRRCSRSR